MLGKYLDKILFIVVLGYIVFNVYTFCEVFYPYDCTDPNSCVFPVFLEDNVTIEGFIYSGNKASKSQKIAVSPFGIIEGTTWSEEVVVPSSIFKNTTATLEFQIQTVGKVSIFKRSINIASHRPPTPKAFNLVSNEVKDKVQSYLQPVIHWLSHLQIYVLKDNVSFGAHSIPHEIHPLLSTFRMDRRLVYTPIIHVDPQLQPTYFWTSLPETPTQKLNFTIEVIPLSIGKFRLRCMLAQAAEQLKHMGVKDKDIEDIQGIFTETNLYLLLTTIVVSAFHLFFDFLAFKNDVQFWRKTSNTSGISLRTIIWRCISTTIIFLYLYEERSSMLVVIPAGISMVIEFWKLCRMTKVSFHLSGGFSVGERSREERETDELDAHYMRRLMYLMFPLCLGGAVYSLLYMPHRSWRSWILQTAVNGVYAFGFLLMTPQLFINYKLKSVANLPWRALTYKAFNTFIDDFFAFIIKMPTAHRVACFRDDIVFVIYMYQRWLYPVDHSRTSEFGEEEAGPSRRKDGSKSRSKAKAN